MLGARKDEVFVAPGLHWLVATLHDAAAFGYPPEAAEAAGYRRELEHAVAGLQEMRRRGARVRPGFYADLLLVDGDPLQDVTVLQDPTRLTGIREGGAFHKDPGDGTPPPRARTTDRPVIVTVTA
ncbi:hypothetical protein O1L60_41215 [Streptomyces diastatochromogenes]|nr:hypothetical protein [Streptomyces diastatochromogenes]